MTNGIWGDDPPGDNPYYEHGAGRRMNQQRGKYGCPWLLLLVGVVVVGLGRLVWALVAWGGAA